jgi:hypothetical protein
MSKRTKTDASDDHSFLRGQKGVGVPRPARIEEIRGPGLPFVASALGTGETRVTLKPPQTAGLDDLRQRWSAHG